MRRSRNILKNRIPQAVGAQQNAVPVSDPFVLIGDGRKLAVWAKVGSVTAASSISLSLYTGYRRDSSGTVTYRSTPDATASVSSDGVVELLIDPTDPSLSGKLPVGPHAIVVATTGAGDAVTVEELFVVEEECRP